MTTEIKVDYFFKVRQSFFILSVSSYDMMRNKCNSFAKKKEELVQI